MAQGNYWVKQLGKLRVTLLVASGQPNSFDSWVPFVFYASAYALVQRHAQSGHLPREEKAQPGSTTTKRNQSTDLPQSNHSAHYITVDLPCTGSGDTCTVAAPPNSALAIHLLNTVKPVHKARPKCADHAGPSRHRPCKTSTLGPTDLASRTHRTRGVGSSEPVSGVKATPKERRKFMNTRMATSSLKTN